MSDKLYDINPDTCSKEEMEEALNKLDKDAGFYETQQLAIKTFINSVYGATASEFFAGFNPAVAEAITLQGQDLNHYSERAVNDYFKGPFQADTELHKKLGIDTEKTKQIRIGLGRLTEGAPLVGPEFEYLDDDVSLTIAGDTDSVSGDSQVYINNKKMTIEEAFDKIKKLGTFDIAFKTSNGSEVVPAKNKFTTLTYKDNEVVERNINYIMRHKVKKAKWRLRTSSGKEIIVTGDHSLMVLRDNELITVKAKDVLKTDKIVTIK